MNVNGYINYNPQN